MSKKDLEDVYFEFMILGIYFKDGMHVDRKEQKTNILKLLGYYINGE